MMNQLANSIQIEIKYLIFQKVTSFGIFLFGETAEATKPPEMHHENILCFNLHCLFGVDGNAECPNHYNRAASLELHTVLAFEDDMLHLMRQQCNT